MDKDLGLFEMINAGDFATVSANPAAASDANQNNGQTFDFNANSNQAAAEGQSADKFFDFGGGSA